MYITLLVICTNALHIPHTTRGDPFIKHRTVMPDSDPPKLGPREPNLVAVLGPMGPNST
jgi:hypothetical protein